MAMETFANDNGTTMFASVVGALALLFVALFGFGAFNTGSPDAVILSIDAPEPSPPEIPRQPPRQVADA